MRPTTGAAYLDGRGAYLPREQRIIDGRTLARDHSEHVDVCVVGTGAGGAVVAKELAEGGMRVAMIEDGDHFPTDAFTGRSGEMMRMLYRDAGLSITLGRPPLLLAMGRAVGGSTVVNAGTSFRTPDRVLERWERESRVDPYLDPFFRRVEREVNVAQVPAEIAGRNAAVARRGAEALGWSGDYIFRNARGCVGSGLCPFGCPTSAKQHTGLVYVPKAWDAGAVTFSACRAERVMFAGRRAVGIEAVARAGGRVRVTAERVIVAAGAIHTPLLLGASGVEHAQLGRNLSLHPASAAFGVMDEPVDLADGVPQSFYVDEFAADGILLESAAGPPDYVAATLPGDGVRHGELMRDYERLAQFGLMVTDSARGTVRGVRGRALVSYTLLDDDVQRIARGLDRVAQLLFAAGAQRVISPLGDLRPGQPRAPIRARDLKLISFHPLGSARADADPKRGVVDAELTVHGCENLHVADGSVVPTPPGVNPQITIMALATRLAYRLLDRPAPEHEPEPEKIAQVGVRPLR